MRPRPILTCGAVGRFDHLALHRERARHVDGAVGLHTAADQPSRCPRAERQLLRATADAEPERHCGGQVLFINRDQTRALGDSIVILPDVAAAPSALQQAEASLGPSVMGGTPEPSPVGTGGTVVSGMSPDQSKEVTILLFTEGRAFARMEFDSAPGEATSQNFVTDGGQKQDIALRVGLST